GRSIIVLRLLSTRSGAAVALAQERFDAALELRAGPQILRIRNHPVAGPAGFEAHRAQGGREKVDRGLYAHCVSSLVTTTPAVRFRRLRRSTTPPSWLIAR